MAIQFPEMKNITSDNAFDNKYDSISNNLKAIKMITKELTVNKIEDTDLLALDLSLSNTELATQDKRSEPRNCRTFELRFKTYNTDLDTFETSNGIVKNYSTNGLFFETKNPLQPNDPVCLSLKERSSDKSDNELAIGVHARVVWCKILNTDFDPSYGVGVKYFEPIESLIECF